MASRSMKTLALVALGAACAFGASLTAQAPASPDVLRALLEEVRGLRAAMEQMASAGPRIELALGRLQLQEQRVNNLLRRHAEIRERLAAAESGAEGMAREIERMQDSMREIADERERKGFELELRQKKELLPLMNAELQRLRTEEAETAQMLGAEQNRWTEINQRLEDLERALTRR